MIFKMKLKLDFIYNAVALFMSVWNKIKIIF